ncbi:MAG: YdeI/OmpD-associated family protein [Chloroflexota bacterium]|nr:YdeI/OmpD-associated family protein [Chloroflexota bacterium]
MSEQHQGRPLVHPGSRAAWRAWLAEHHASVDGVWLARWTKASGRATLTYEAIVEEALCFGWIDGLVHTLNDGRQAQLLTPRRPGSGWARSNKDRVERLIAAGRMADAGLAAIRAAHANGSWSMQDAAEALIEPTELAAALDANPEARRQWDAFPRSPRRALIWWVMSAKRPETRDRRVAQIVSEAAEGRRANY